MLLSYDTQELQSARRAFFDYEEDEDAERDDSEDLGLELQRDYFESIQKEENQEDSEWSIEPEDAPFDPTSRLDDSSVSNGIRWVVARSWIGNSANEDWFFSPRVEDLRRGDSILMVLSEDLRDEAARCLHDSRISAAYHLALRRLLFVNQVVWGWWLQVTGICGIDPEASERWKFVLDTLWRKTPEHHALEKMVRDRPEAKARKREYDKEHDAIRKKTPEARARQREAQKAYRARLKAKEAA